MRRGGVGVSPLPLSSIDHKSSFEMDGKICANNEVRMGFSSYIFCATMMDMVHIARHVCAVMVVADLARNERGFSF